MANFIDSADSDNTKKQIRYSLSVFDNFCKQADVDYGSLNNVALTLDHRFVSVKVLRRSENKNAV